MLYCTVQYSTVQYISNESAHALAAVTQINGTRPGVASARGETCVMRGSGQAAFTVLM